MHLQYETLQGKRGLVTGLGSQEEGSLRQRDHATGRTTLNTTMLMLGRSANI